VAAGIMSSWNLNILSFEFSATVVMNTSKKYTRTGQPKIHVKSVIVNVNPNLALITLD